MSDINGKARTIERIRIVLIWASVIAAVLVIVGCFIWPGLFTDAQKGDTATMSSDGNDTDENDTDENNADGSDAHGNSESMGNAKQGGGAANGSDTGIGDGMLQAPEVTLPPELRAILEKQVDLPRQYTLPELDLPVTQTYIYDVIHSNQIVIRFDTSKGYISIKTDLIETETDSADGMLKVYVTTPDGTKYTYNLITGIDNVFPLNGGNGEYSVAVFQRVEHTKYRAVVSHKLDVELENEYAPFLVANQYVSFADDDPVAAKAAQLTKGLNDTVDKIDVIYHYVIENIYFEFDPEIHKTGDISHDAGAILARGTGICTDYTILMSAMLRSLGIPAKVVMGYTEDVYHSWVEVYSDTPGFVDGAIAFDATDWVRMDPTFASSYAGQSNESLKMAILEYISNDMNYMAEYYY